MDMLDGYAVLMNTIVATLTLVIGITNFELLVRGLAVVMHPHTAMQ